MKGHPKVHVELSILTLHHVAPIHAGIVLDQEVIQIWDAVLYDGGGCLDPLSIYNEEKGAKYFQPTMAFDLPVHGNLYLFQLLGVDYSAFGALTIFWCLH